MKLTIGNTIRCDHRNHPRSSAQQHKKVAVAAIFTSSLPCELNGKNICYESNSGERLIKIRNNVF